MKEYRPKFTIIITAYNIENYISECIASVKAQSFSDFECIIADDGSSDGTFLNAQKSISTDERFTVFSFPHGGPQNAKAEGLKRARGEYILFTDGDDTLQPDCLYSCEKNLNGCDLLIFGINFQNYSDGKTESEKKSELPDMEFSSGGELADWYINNHKLLLYSNANKCYRLDTLRLHNINFRSDLSFGEDRLFNFDFLKVSGKIKTISGVLYNYRKINENSVTSLFRKHHIDELVYLHKIKTEYLFSISTHASEDEKNDFVKYDIKKAVCESFRHLAEHIDDLSDDEAQNEISYISRYPLPEYFYSESCRTRDNLIEYINSIVFPESIEADTEGKCPVVVLGSRKCHYRIKGAFEKFGNTKYICCGGNISSYKDDTGNSLTEAEYMAFYLKNAGVKDIKIENNSSNTFENIKNAVTLTEKDANPVVVTGAFHLKRTRRILNDMGLDWSIFPLFGPNTKRDNWYKTKDGIMTIISEFEKGM